MEVLRGVALECQLPGVGRLEYSWFVWFFFFLFASDTLPTEAQSSFAAVTPAVTGKKED